MFYLTYLRREMRHRIRQATVIAIGLAARVTVTVIVLAVAGGLVAGSLGSWRAARLRPAAALSRVE